MYLRYEEQFSRGGGKFKLETNVFFLAEKSNCQFRELGNWREGQRKCSFTNARPSLELGQPRLNSFHWVTLEKSATAELEVPNGVVYKLFQT